MVSAFAKSFRKPRYMSPQLAEFLHLPLEIPIRVTEIGKLMTAYIRKNNLIVFGSREVVLNDELRELFNLTDVDNVTFNIFHTITLLKHQYTSGENSNHEQ